MGMIALSPREDTVPFLDLGALHREMGVELDEAWRRVIDSSRFVGGEFVATFEAEWAAYCDCLHCVGLSDGTAAIELALRALGVGKGDEVIVPANTFIATFEAVVAVGALPVPVDVDPHTLLMTAAQVDAACTGKSAAVIAVHLFGQPVNMDAINAVARRRGLLVLEDAAQAHGATWRGQRAGSMSDAGCFSFYPGKNLGALGDGGAVVTNSPLVAEKIRSLANHGREAGAPERHSLIGANHRLDGLQAAVLSAKLRHLDRWNAARAKIARRYAAAFAALPVEEVLIAGEATSSHHLEVIQADNRDDLKRALAAAGVATGIHYAIPCHRQPAFADWTALDLPVVERAASRMLSLPMYPQMTEAQVDYVCDALVDALAPRPWPDMLSVLQDKAGASPIRVTSGFPHEQRRAG